MISTLVAILLMGLSLFGLVHSYVLYPLIVRFLARNKIPNQVCFQQSELPKVSVLMSLYNEEKVIAEKLESLLKVDYPTEKIQFYIGSDCSDDATHSIVEKYTNQRNNFYFFPFQERRGKPSVINDLTDAALAKWEEADDHIMIVTDASVLLREKTLFNLVRHFKNEKIDLVDAHMVHFGMEKTGISEAENQYISSEVNLKHQEGLLWQKMIGPFGGCYAIRSNKFSKVPPNRLVDDFYIAMKVFEQGGGAISDLEAVCEEAVSHDIWVEFRRKKRIAAGSFQNMFTFWRLWFPPFSKVGFSFFSHKILRWLGPFFLLAILLSSAFLAYQKLFFFQLLLLGQIIFYLGIPSLDWLFQKLKINNLLLRKLNYFILMNVALFQGFFKFLKGIESGAWSPTKR